MKLKKRLAALLLACGIGLSLTACSPKDAAADLVYNVVKAMGLVSADDDEAEETTDVYAPAGGSITFPEGMDTGSRLNTQVEGDTMYIAFNGIQNRSTSYFTAASDSVTITSYATTESTGLLEYKSALWELSEDQTTTAYVQGTTVYYTTGGDCYTQTVTGLTPGKKYKVYISYDSHAYYITGAMTVQGLGTGELTNVEGENAQA